MKNKNDIFKKLKTFKRKYPEGFTENEPKDFLKSYPEIHIAELLQAMDVITCAIKNDEVLFYQTDIEKGLRCIIEARGLYLYEWD